jgi:serine/threonine-protein kinase
MRGSFKRRYSLVPPSVKYQAGNELEGRFLIKRSLGAGGFGEVWLAQDKEVGRQVAIKVLKSERLREGNQSLTQKYIKRFEREMKIVGQLGTRYSPSLHEIYRMKDGRTLYVMEYLSGTNLGNLRNGLAQKNPEILARFPTEKRMEIFEEICEALEWAHFRGFVHMDLKPDNIYITAEQNSEGSEKIGVKVLDWGQANGVAELLQQSPLSKEGRISLPDLEEFQENLTKDGALSGTAGYIAPERFLNQPLENPRSPDIFDLGVILYEWITGVHPYATFIRGDSRRKQFPGGG